MMALMMMMMFIMIIMIMYHTKTYQNYMGMLGWIFDEVEVNGTECADQNYDDTDDDAEENYDKKLKNGLKVE